MIIFWILLIFMAVYIVRAVRGPSIWDRLLSLSLVSTKIILIAINYASFRETAYILDFALLYAMLGFISIIFTALFLLNRIKKSETGDGAGK